MGNHLGPLPEASDGPEGQEPPVRAVGCQGELQEVTHLPSLLETWNFIFFKCHILGYWKSDKAYWTLDIITFSL